MAKKALILDGRVGPEPQGEEVLALVEHRLRLAEYRPETVTLRDLDIAPCIGCFGCWIRTPGECVIDDDGREVARQIVQSHLVTFFTPVVFGGYAHTLKTALDRSIGNLSPLFRKLGGELHHHRRYAVYPDLLAVGLCAANSEEASIFEDLVQRNALNLYATRAVACALPADREMAYWQGQITSAVAEVTM